MNEIIKEFGFTKNANIEEITRGGSARKFYRIKENNRSIIFIKSNEDDKEFVNYIEVNKFLSKIGVSVPEIYYYDLEKKIIVEEDLGDYTLQEYIISTGDVNFYKKVIDILVFMQIEGGKRIDECIYVKNRVFGYSDFIWETNYFNKYFLIEYCKIKEDLEDEFHNLAMKLIYEDKYFMHRDFQSQNIILKNKKEIKIIDFQSARYGLLYYDLASILKDAYVKIKKEDRENLLNYYIKKLNEYKINIDEKMFNRLFLYTSLQRNMQALGAFSYLTLIRKKLQFEKYIPQCLCYLMETLDELNEFDKLKKVIEKVNESRGI